MLLLAGDSERVLKLVEIEYLYGCVPHPKRMVIFPGAGHEDLLSYDPRRYARAVGDFLKEYAPGGPIASSESSLPALPLAQAGPALAVAVPPFPWRIWHGRLWETGQDADAAPTGFNRT